MTPTRVDETELSCRVSEGFGVDLTDLAPVAGGADTLASVWRGSAADGRAFAVKVSHAGLSDGLQASWLLCRNGVRGVPEPVRALDGTLWTSLGAAQVSLVPWVSGRRALDRELTASEWQAFGALVAQLHALGPSVTGTGLPEADYRPTTVETMDELHARLRSRAGSRHPGGVADPSEPTVDLAAALVGIWFEYADRLIEIADATYALGRTLRDRPCPLVVTHGDAHLGNVIIGEDNQLWLLDWDSAALASPERDLMFVVAGVLTGHPVNATQQSWFFDGYGPASLDLTRLAYFTGARAVEEVISWAASVVDEDSPPEDRAQALAIFRGLMTSTGIVVIAQRFLDHVDVG